MQTDPTMTAGMMALALALVKIIESLVTWIFKKMSGNGHGRAIVELGPEATVMIRETYSRVTDIHEIATRTTPDGAPMIYGPRHEVRQLASAVEGIGDAVDDLSEKIENNKNCKD